MRYSNKVVFLLLTVIISSLNRPSFERLREACFRTNMEDLGLSSILFAFLLHVRTSVCYDPVDACRYRLVNETEWNWITCPTYPTSPEHERVPAYCCGTDDEEKTCCEWSAYVINSAGFGRTGLGLVVFVFVFFLMSLVFVISVCAVFNLVCLRQLERSHSRSSGSVRRRSGLVFSSRANSTREGPRSSVGTVYTTDAEAQVHAVTRMKEVLVDERFPPAPVMV